MKNNIAYIKNLFSVKYLIFFVFIMIFMKTSSSQKIIPFSEIDKTLNSLVTENRTPSVQYLIFNKDSTIHYYKSGYATISKQQKVDEKTTYNAYSVTKTFTATAILQLAEQKKIDINDPVRKYLLDFPYDTLITIKQLLSHTSGIPNPIPLSWIHLSSEHNSFESDSFFDPVFERYYKLKSEPGEKYAYSNLGYVLLGKLIEKVTGDSYEHYITENILGKLNINPEESGFVIRDSTIHSTGYQKRASLSNIILGLLIDKSKYMAMREGKWRAFRDIYVNGSPYGGLISIPGSLQKYIQDLLKSSRGLLSPGSKKMLFSETLTNRGRKTGMCLAWFSGQLNGNQYFAHAGGGGGYYCEIRIYPDNGIGSVIMFNRTGMTDERFLDKIDKYYFEESGDPSKNE